MALPLYLAQTAAEFTACSHRPPELAWMACHFSPYGTGLSNLPPTLPPDAMVILNDRTPIRGHDPQTILAQLTQLQPARLLLDFQRPVCSEAAALAEFLSREMPCPVGVSDGYAQGLSCPVFLPPVPLDVPLAAHFAPWQGREIWLEAALGGLSYAVTAKGAQALPLPCPPENGQLDPVLHCHYRITLSETQAEFALWRTREDLDALLEQAQAQGAVLAVGLWQELGTP